MILEVILAIVIPVMMAMVKHVQTLMNARRLFVTRMHTVQISEADMTVPVNSVLRVTALCVKVTF